MTFHTERRKRLLSLAKEKQAVAIKPANIFYLTNFWGGGAAIVHPDKTFLVTSALDSRRAEEVGKGVEVLVVKRWADLAPTIARMTRRNEVIVDDDGPFRRLKRFSGGGNTFLEARRVKDEMEIERIKKASEGQDKIFELLETEIKQGRGEWEIAAKVMEEATLNRLTQSGSDSALSPIIIASGENGSFPHSELSDRTVRNGDLVVADIFFRYEGYNSDETRTFAVGTIDGEKKANYQAVFESQTSGLERVQIGAKCGTIDKVSRAKLREHGVEKLLNHGIGHGVGIDIHELPSIARGSNVKLFRNDVVTVEPGVYLPGRYGIRIEDTARVDSKPDVLTRYTKELVTVG